MILFNFLSNYRGMLLRIMQCFPNRLSYWYWFRFSKGTVRLWHGLNQEINQFFIGKYSISSKMRVIFLHWTNCLNGEYQNYHSVLQCKVLFCLRQLSHLRRLHTAIKHPQLFHCLHEEDEGVYFMFAWNIFATFTTLPIWAAHNNGVHPLLSFWSILAPFFNKISTTFAYPKLSFERFVFD